MGGRNRNGRGARAEGDRKRGVDGFSVTLGWADSATGEPEHEIALTGEQWDGVYMRCLQLTRGGAKVLEKLQIEHLDLDSLTLEKVDGAKLFYNNADLIEYVNEEGERL